MKKNFVLIFIFILLAVSCKYDDSTLTEQVNNLDNRVQKLEELCTEMNTNIDALQTIVNALEDKDYITSVIPVTKGDKEIGYTISFSKSNSITIYNGEKGKDGYSPIIGITKYTDGIYYWTLDGEWLYDTEGNMIKAIGEKGITPQVKIENNYWYVSYDDSKTWTKLGKAIGEDGDSFFKSVDISNKDYVIFTLADGTEITLPKKVSNQFELNIETSKDIFCEAGENVQLNFSITEGGEEPQVECIGENGWIGNVTMNNSSEGIINITAPNPYKNGKVIVFVTNDKKQIIMKVLTFTNKLLSITSGDTYRISKDGGLLEIKIKTNMDYSLNIPEDAKSWLNHISTKTVRNETIILEVAKNEEVLSRETTLTLTTAEGNKTLSIFIYQLGDTFYSSGDGSQSSPYLIEYEEQLINLANFVNQGNSLENQYIKITKDLDFLNKNFVTIGTSIHPFKGNIDGGDNTVSNFQVSGSEYLGMFGFTENASIKNIVIENAKVSGENYLGILIGQGDRTTVKNVTVSGTIDSGSSIGGIMGIAINSSIDNCFNNASIGNTRSQYIGGIVGKSENTVITNSANDGSLKGFDSFGGIVGYSDSKTHVTNCCNQAQFTQATLYGTVGGIVGYNCGYLTACVMNNTINAALGIGGTSFTKSSTGAICGYNHPGSVLLKCFFIQFSTLNSEIEYCGSLNWGSCSYCGPYNVSGYYNGSKVTDLLNSWVHAQSDMEYKEWEGTYPKFKK